MFEILRKIEVNEQIVRLIEEIDTDNVIRVRSGNMSEAKKIGRGVRQGCPMSCSLFNIYFDNMIKEWLKSKPKRLDINDTHVNTLLFANDQVVFSDNEDDLQRAMYNLQKVADKYGMRISSSKTKVMAFKGIEPICSEIVVNGPPVEQVKSFKYLGCELLYEGEVDAQLKISKFLRVSRVINRAIPPRKVRAET